MLRDIYFGTYTKRQSQGIYKATFDTQTGHITTPKLLAKTSSPTYLAFSPNHLLSVMNSSDTGGVTAFWDNGRACDQILASGAGPCYISYDQKRQLVYTANYHKGQVTSYRLTDEGKLTLLDQISTEGSGPHPNQRSSHLHFADLTPDNYLVTCDLGADCLRTFDIDAEGKLHQIASYQTERGAGCRHLIFHPSLKMAYLVCELNSTVEVLFYDGMGEFAYFQTLSTLPNGYDGDNSAAAIVMSKDAHFLYTSNRGHNSIAVFRIIGDGELELIQHVDTAGKIPRDMTLSPDNKFLIVANKDSDNVTVFKRHPETGTLSLIQKDIQVPEAVCLAFNPYQD